MKILDFKTVSPLFEMERDGIKPFTTRLADWKDNRFRAIQQCCDENRIAIRITNPVDGENFTREFTGWWYVRRYDIGGASEEIKPTWIMIFLGARLADDN